jgi:hypothetical protein
MDRTEWKTSIIGATDVEHELNNHQRQGYKLFDIYPAGVQFLLIWSK